MNRVELAPRALAQVRAVDEWWRRNRLVAPALFADELANALEMLERGALVGVVYPFPLFEVRRFLLPRSRYHVYDSLDGDLVKVRAVWHTSRGKGPALR
jgi:plasmid stabilization system protein ParE